MVARLHSAWVRAAAVGLLSAWLPCMPLGLCVRAPEKANSHGCCPRQQPAVKITAASPECWLKAPAPLPAGPTPPTTAGPVAIAHTRPVAQTAVMQDPRPTSFSPLAIVLRI
jgi:hypothetical protein